MVGWESESCRICADLCRQFLSRVRQANPVTLSRTAPVWKNDAEQPGSRGRSRDERGQNDDEEGRNEERDKKAKGKVRIETKSKQET